MGLDRRLADEESDGDFGQALEAGGGARSSYFGPPVEPKFRAIRGRLRVAGDDA